MQLAVFEHPMPVWNQLAHLPLKREHNNFPKFVHAPIGGVEIDFSRGARVFEWPILRPLEAAEW
jgi:hypothetical protein